MSKKYLYVVSFHGDTVTKTEISRETEKSFWNVNGYRQSKCSDYCNAFSTLKEAKMFMIGKKKIEIERAKSNVAFWSKRVPELEKELEDLKKEVK